MDSPNAAHSERVDNCGAGRRSVIEVIKPLVVFNDNPPAVRGAALAGSAFPCAIHLVCVGGAAAVTRSDGPYSLRTKQTEPV
ncbi:hypothetical protein EVAR_45857_1 [Eumeta japonica]|uniref:Uncharacterized protein n=1 Tax=Eumeta variegata TaxID=151549 RepID=A0A4C1WKP1_EUMVA|nr:hypothetical protein EVAR_45857_1 [Eumeta japonica]